MIVDQELWTDVRVLESTDKNVNGIVRAEDDDWNVCEL